MSSVRFLEAKVLRAANGDGLGGRGVRALSDSVSLNLLIAENGAARESPMRDYHCPSKRRLGNYYPELNMAFCHYNRCKRMI